MTIPEQFQQTLTPPKDPSRWPFDTPWIMREMRRLCWRRRVKLIWFLIINRV